MWLLWNDAQLAVSYTYDSGHRVTSRSDAKGQQVQYDYNEPYKRLTEVRHYVNSAEHVNQRVDYSYDYDLTGLPPTSPPSSFPLGRLSAVSFANQDPKSTGQLCLPVHLQPGRRIHTQRLRYNPAYPSANPNAVDLDATYQWDTEGR